MPEFTYNQQQVEMLVSRCIAEAADALETNEGLLFDAVMRAEKLESAMDAVLQLWPHLSVSVLADVLHRGLVAAGCWGILTAQQETEEAIAEGELATDFAADGDTEISLEPLAMPEALAFWRDKIRLSPSQFGKLSDEARLRAFAVSGIAKGDELETVYQALAKALAKGSTLAEFKRDCAKIFERRGWVGKRCWRVDNIYRTNLQTAYNVGRYKRQKASARFLPYLQYSAVNDSRTRPTHRALDGLVFPVDHEFWDHWYPPNGFMCRCGTLALTKGQVERMGLRVETEDPTGSLIEPIDPRTGNSLPARQLLPDIGWDYHPGKAVWGGLAKLDGKAGLFEPLDNLPGPAQYKRETDLAAIPDAELPLIRNERLMVVNRKAPGAPPEDADYIQEFKERYGEEAALTDALGEVVLLSLRSFLVNKGAKPGEEEWKFQKPGHGEIIPLLAELIAHPYEIWLTPQSDKNGKIRLSKRYISIWRDESSNRRASLLVFEVVRGVFSGVTAFMPLRKGKPDKAYIKKQRLGLLLYGQGKRNK